MNNQEKISRFAQILQQAKQAYVLTGAGISTESGIPDYRSPKTGLWTKVDPMKTATVSVLMSDPDYFWLSNLPRYKYIAEMGRPNLGHRALATLEEKGLIEGIITQNIDGLHQKAGSRKVWELHGHLRSVRCMYCANEVSFKAAVSMVEQTNSAPKCEKCGGILRPNIVLFEDPMDETFSTVSEFLPRSDLLIIAGTSLQVYPAASLPQFVNNLIIINLEPTRFDSGSQLVIHDNIGQVFDSLVKELKISPKG